MDIYKGNGAFPGIAIGKIVYYHKSEYQIRQYEITDVKSELSIFRQARARVIEQLTELYEKNCTIQESQAELFLRQKDLLEGKSFQRAIESIIQNEKVNSAYAVMTTRDEILSTFRNLEEPAIKERLANIREISDRLISELGGVSPRIDLGDEPVIVVAEDLAPSETVQMDKSKLLAFVTRLGSSNSHTAILARTMNIPALIGIDIKEEWNGKMAIVDGKTGTFYVDPDVATLEKFLAEKKKEEEARELLSQLKGQPDETVDGRHIHLYANIGSVADVANVLANDAAGIGLFRSEFLYLEKDHYPTEEEQFQVYKTVAQNMAGKKVVIRTLDIGADKQVDYFNMEHEDNPAMGYRAIRICLDRVEIFKTQLRALYRASAFGTISIMFPMIISVKEVQQIKKICAEVRDELDAGNVEYGDVELGIMIETPAAVMISDLLAKEVDFFSIGTNDLTQYTLAIDRQNPKLDNIYDSHHPAILRMIQMVIDNGHKENCWVGICGELGADTSLTEQFVKMGIDELSVSPTFVLPVRKAIRETSFH